MDRVELQPWPASAWPLAFHWARESSYWVFDDFASTSQRKWVDQQIRRAAHDYGVFVDGELGGLIQGDRISPVVVQAHFLFKRHFCTPDITAQAAELAKREAWELGYKKIWCLVDLENRAIMRVIRRAGGVPEGILVKHVQKAGRLCDIASWAILKGE